ncbi:hypothetical protein ABFS82_06G174300 [Erythranthe guttata]
MEAQKSFFIGLIFMALLLTSVKGEEHKEIVLQGKCSEFPDCNKHCQEKGFIVGGGKCIKLNPNVEDLFCVCYV